MSLEDLNPFTKEDDNTPQFSRRSILAMMASSTLLSACGGTSNRTNRVIDRPRATPRTLKSLPEDSLIKSHVEAHPEVAQNYKLGVQRMRAAEAADNAPARGKSVFEGMVQQTQPTMIVPDSDQVLADMETLQPKAFEYFKDLAPGAHGIYIDGQNKYLYIMEGSAQGPKAIRRVLVTTGAAGFSNVNNSKGTPLGAWPVQDIRSGRLGEVMAYRDADGCPVGSLINTFQQGQVGQSNHACIVSEYIAINTLRGIGIHGTNYELDHNGNLRMQQDASGGCIRCTNADIIAIMASGYVTEGMKVFITNTSTKPAIPTPQTNTSATAAPTSIKPSTAPTTSTPSPIIPTTPQVVPTETVPDIDTPIWG